jgi:hypothetical protein
MIERVIENWLTNTNERGYEIPFCQLLISEGYTILGMSFHGQVEQGKDIIALNKRGAPCAFQLKSGNINQYAWNKIKSEIDDLLEMPIKHPKINSQLKRHCFLITNGIINDKIKKDITDRNVGLKQRGLPALKIYDGPELLSKFLAINGRFLPTQPPDLRVFLELLMFDGRKMLDKDLLSRFLEAILFAKKDTEQQVRRKIASCILMNQYVMEPFEVQKNHIAVIEGWTILYSYILFLVEKYQLKESSWRPSLEIIKEKINYELVTLKDEFFSRRDYTEGTWDGGLIHKSRITIVLGWLAAFELFMKKTNPSYTFDTRIIDRIKNYYGSKTWFWGESATPLFIMMSKLAVETGEKTLSNKIVCDLLIDILFKNGFVNENALPPPYFSVTQCVNHVYGHPDERIELSQFSGESYHLAVLIDILVRRNRRDLVSELWKSITGLSNAEVKPTYPYEIFKWHCKEGKLAGFFFKNPQSWNELQKNARDLDNLVVANQLKNPFCYYFLICYPHRLCRQTGKLLD